ncbi:unnamed protein product, partial [Allacma fusca]
KRKRFTRAFAQKRNDQKSDGNTNPENSLETPKTKFFENNSLEMELPPSDDELVEEKIQFEGREVETKNQIPEELLKTVLKYGTSLLHHLIEEDYANLPSGVISLKKTDSKPNQRSTERLNPGNNSISKWLLSLVRVEGDTLANFLRIYRVQLLFDLAFSIFKWFFYAYLGWFIP